MRASLIFMLSSLCLPGLGCPDEGRSIEPSAAPSVEPSVVSSPTNPTAKAPEGPATTDWASAFRHGLRYDPGRRAVIVSVALDPGFHAYTVGETIGRPMVLEFAPESDYVEDGAIEYPKGIVKDLPIGRSVIVEGEAEISATVKRRSGASGQEARGVFRYQVCTDQACDRPRTSPFSLAIETAEEPQR